MTDKEGWEKKLELIVTELKEGRDLPLCLESQGKKGGDSPNMMLGSQRKRGREEEDVVPLPRFIILPGWM